MDSPIQISLIRILDIENPLNNIHGVDHEIEASNTGIALMVSMQYEMFQGVHHRTQLHHIYVIRDADDCLIGLVQLRMDIICQWGLLHIQITSNRSNGVISVGELCHRAVRINIECISGI